MGGGSKAHCAAADDGVSSCLSQERGWGGRELLLPHRARGELGMQDPGLHLSYPGKGLPSFPRLPPILALSPTACSPCVSSPLGLSSRGRQTGH